MIKVEQEPKEETKAWRGLKEHCVSCDAPTTFWHKGSNTPCCQNCAKTLTTKTLVAKKRKAYAL